MMIESYQLLQVVSPSVVGGVSIYQKLSLQPPLPIIILKCPHIANCYLSLVIKNLKHSVRVERPTVLVRMRVSSYSSVGSKINLTKVASIAVEYPRTS